MFMNRVLLAVSAFCFFINVSVAATRDLPMLLFIENKTTNNLLYTASDDGELHYFIAHPGRKVEDAIFGKHLRMDVRFSLSSMTHRMQDCRIEFDTLGIATRTISVKYQGDGYLSCEITETTYKNNYNDIKI